jgi:hypothetical protein
MAVCVALGLRLLLVSGTLLPQVPIANSKRNANLCGYSLWMSCCVLYISSVLKLSAGWDLLIGTFGKHGLVGPAAALPAGELCGVRRNGVVECCFGVCYV